MWSQNYAPYEDETWHEYALIPVVDFTNFLMHRKHIVGLN